MAEKLLDEMIQKINQIMASLDGTIAQINQMSGAINQMTQNFSEQTVAMTENIRLIVEVLKQFRVQSSKNLQELSDDFNLKIKELSINVRYDIGKSSKHPIDHGLSVINSIVKIISEKHPLMFFGVFGKNINNTSSRTIYLNI